MEEKKKFYTEAVKRAIYKYRATHKDKQAKIFADWKAKNVLHLKEYSKEYYKKNKEKILQSRKEKYIKIDLNTNQYETVEDGKVSERKSI